MDFFQQFAANQHFLIFTALKIAAIFGFTLTFVAYTVLIERKVAAYVQDRIGPNRVGPGGLLQPLADGLKFILKEDYTPAHVRKGYFWLAPAIAMVPALLTVAIIPFGSFLGSEKMIIADLNVGVLYTFGIVSLGVYGIVLAGYAANSKYPFLGGIRSSAQMISYEIAMGLSVIPLFLLISDPGFYAGLTETSSRWAEFLAGTSGLNLNRVVAYQSDSIFHWLVFKQPLAFFMFLVSAFAETNRLPFDFPESEQELVAGYHTEYSSMKFALFFLGEYANMIASSALMVTLFFGGWTLPFAGLDQPASSLASGLLHIGIFLGKLLGVLMVIIWVRWMWPRFRYDQLMHLGWQRFLPLALLNIVITAAWLWWRAS